MAIIQSVEGSCWHASHGTGACAPCQRRRRVRAMFTHSHVATTAKVIIPPTVDIMVGRSPTKSQAQIGAAADSTSITSDNSLTGTFRALVRRHAVQTVCRPRPQNTHKNPSHMLTAKELEKNDDIAIDNSAPRIATGSMSLLCFTLPPRMTTK